MPDDAAPPHPTAPKVGVGVILIKNDQVLLVQRANPPGAGKWSLPGGKQKLGETAQDAARRELREETGLECGELILAGYVDSIHHDQTGQILFHYTILDFMARYIGGEPCAADDTLAVAWVTPDEFDDYDLWDKARALIITAVSFF